MAVKVKFDVAALKNWLFQHGEKVALGLMVVIFVLFTYSAIRREVLEASKQPEKLKELASGVQSRLTSSRWDEKNAGVKIVDFEKRSESKALATNAFPLVHPWNPPVIDAKATRDAPQVFPVEELRAGSGFSIFALKAPDKKDGDVPVGNLGGRNKAQAWAVITGLVPIEKQMQEYGRAFGNAMGDDKERDKPHYARPVVERAEIDPARPDKLEWKRIPYPKDQEEQWGGKTTEIVSAHFLDPNLSGNLGPIVNESWSEAVSHPKVLALEEESRQAAQAIVAPPAANANAGGDAPPAAEFDRSADAMRPNQTQPGHAAAKPAGDQPKVIPFRLMRFFDYTVVPEKKYRYRVKLGLMNPNFGLQPPMLKDPKSAAAEYLSTEFSPPTEVVTIPSGYGVLAGKVEPSKGSSEPSVKLRVTAINNDEGVPSAAELARAFRGTLANPEGQKSNILVLDIHGKVLPGRRKDVSPGEVLLLDHGQLTVRSELDDEQQFEEVLGPGEKEEPKAKAKGPLNDDKKEDRKKAKAVKSAKTSKP